MKRLAIGHNKLSRVNGGAKPSEWRRDAESMAGRAETRAEQTYARKSRSTYIRCKGLSHFGVLLLLLLLLPLVTFPNPLIPLGFGHYGVAASKLNLQQDAVVPES